LHRVGIVVPQPKLEVYEEDYDEPIWIKVQTMDSRRCPLSGDITVSKVSPYMRSIEFTKAKGDPLEWRRFFQKNRGIIKGCGIPRRGRPLLDMGIALSTLQGQHTIA